MAETELAIVLLLYTLKRPNKMTNEEAALIVESVHSMKNSLNKITLNAELGKMLLDESASVENLNGPFSSILEACLECDLVLTKTRAMVSQ